ncbi:putative reverse transcriptase domain, reverse transcriptase zinc-binding domain protein, partial [Tanacetum coccineum]
MENQWSRITHEQYQNEVNDICAERIAKSANPLALLAAAQPYSDNYYQAPKPQRTNTTSSQSLRHSSYSINVNGNVHGWFKGKRGLRQGDLLSPYLFTLVMEILTLLLQRK